MHITKKQVLVAGLLSILLMTQWTQMVNALDVRFYTGNGILWESPDAAKCAAGAGGGAASPVGSILNGTYPENPPPEQWPRTVWDFLTGSSLPPAAAAGIMGNLQTESTNYRTGTSFIGVPFNPDATEFPGQNIGGYGLAQWTGGRRDDLNAKVPPGTTVGNIYYQLEFLFEEINARQAIKPSGGTEFDGLKTQTDPVQAAVFFHDNFERSADTPTAVIVNRGGRAQTWYDLFNGEPGSSGVTAGGGGACPPAKADTSSFLSTVKSYALPKYEPTTTNSKPEYTAAVKVAIGEGRYVGGGQADPYRGIDCGGFVTTLMYDSGFDKLYNSSGKGGNTGPQKQWLDANWTKLGDGSIIDTSKLQPGDVAISTAHTFVYVGKDVSPEFGKDDPDFSGVASASYGGTGAPWRSPMAGHESLASYGFTWYRKSSTVQTQQRGVESKL